MYGVIASGSLAGMLQHQIHGRGTNVLNSGSGLHIGLYLTVYIGQYIGNYSGVISTTLPI